MCLWKKLSLPVLPQYWVVKLGPHILKQLFCLKVPIFCFEKESWEVTLAALEFVISCQSFQSNWGDKLEPRQGTMHVTFHIQTLKSDILYVSLLRFWFWRRDFVTKSTKLASVFLSLPLKSWAHMGIWQWL